MRVKLVLFATLCLVLLVPAIASAETISGGLRLGHGRLLPSAAALVGLFGIVMGRRAVAASRSAARVGTRDVQAGAIVAVVIGAVVMVVGGLHAVFSAGGFGTGNGLAGAIAAMLVGLISLVMGGLALARTWASS